MADISITRKHALPHAKAKAAAQKLADRMAEKYAMQSEWNGDVLEFQRSGMSGTLAVGETEARIEISLGFLFKAFSGQIEEEIARNIGKVFGSGKA